jgi:hypothetical protein
MKAEVDSIISEDSGIINISIKIAQYAQLYDVDNLKELVEKIETVIQDHKEPNHQVLCRMQDIVKNLYGVTVHEKSLCFKTQFDFNSKTYSFYAKDIETLMSKKVKKKRELFKGAGILLEEYFEGEVFKTVYDESAEIRVSNFGRLIRIEDGLEVLITGGVTDGYIRVSIDKRRVYLHQLVAVAFLNHIIDGHNLVVDHINGDTLDNRAVNLQILTNSENVAKGMRMKKELAQKNRRLKEIFPFN